MKNKLGPWSVKFVLDSHTRYDINIYTYGTKTGECGLHQIFFDKYFVGWAGNICDFFYYISFNGGGSHFRILQLFFSYFL